MSRSTLSIVLVSSFALLSCQEETIPTSPERDVLLSPSVEASSELVYEIEQDGNTVQVQPLLGSESASSFYAYRSGGTGDSGDTGLEKSNTTRLFLYKAPDGTVSLFFLNDAPFDGSGGKVAFALSGLPSGVAFVVKDDPPTQDLRDSYSPSGVTWAWNASNGDGTVISGGFDMAFETTVTPGIRSGISNWEFLSGDLSSPTAISLDLSKSLTIRTTEGNCPDQIQIPLESGPATRQDAICIVRQEVFPTLTPSPEIVGLAAQEPLPPGTELTEYLAPSDPLASGGFVKFVTAEEAYLVFLDPAPLTGYLHRVYYVLVSTADGTFQEFSALSTPVVNGVPLYSNFEQRITSADRFHPDLGAIAASALPTSALRSVNFASEIVTVEGECDIVSLHFAGPDPRTLTSVLRIERWLKEKAFASTRIISSGPDSSSRSDVKGNLPFLISQITDIATQLVDDCDILVLNGASHGWRGQGNASPAWFDWGGPDLWYNHQAHGEQVVELPDGTKIAAWIPGFQRVLESIEVENVFVVMEACFVGGLIEHLKEPPVFRPQGRVAIYTASAADELAYFARHDTDFVSYLADGFQQPLMFSSKFAGSLGLRPVEDPASADGEITADELQRWLDAAFVDAKTFMVSLGEIGNPDARGFDAKRGTQTPQRATFCPRNPGGGDPGTRWEPGQCPH